MLYNFVMSVRPSVRPSVCLSACVYVHMRGTNLHNWTDFHEI